MEPNENYKNYKSGLGSQIYEKIIPWEAGDLWTEDGLEGLGTEHNVKGGYWYVRTLFKVGDFKYLSFCSLITCGMAVTAVRVPNRFRVPTQTCPKLNIFFRLSGEEVWERRSWTVMENIITARSAPHLSVLSINQGWELLSRVTIPRVGKSFSPQINLCNIDKPSNPVDEEQFINTQRV